MIQKGSTIVLRTKTAEYTTCKVVGLSRENITITYSAGARRDRETGKMQSDHPVETIPRKDVVSMSERC